MTGFPSVTRIDNIVSMALLLKEWRERRGWSLRQLGERSGVSFVNISKIEAGKLDPRLSTLERLARALGISTRNLFSTERRRTPRRRR
jgi:transcriptional regulator with XRE-family HTH domain